eukprot:jgi/Bigna1/85287/estExt_fgenesh1_pg.C_30150
MADNTSVVRSQSEGKGGLTVVAQAIGPTTPKKATAWFLWLLGLYIMLIARAPVEITKEMEAQYMAIMEDAEGIREIRTPIVVKINELDKEMNAHTGGIPLYWRLDEEKSKIVNELWSKRSEYEAELKKVESKIDSIESDAKSKLGLWSNRGLSEARQKFWEKVDAGKAFAKRQTLWDAITSILFTQRRDEESLQFIIRWVLQIAFNFTIGFFLTLINFTFSIIWVIRSFQPSFISGMAFYGLALLGATSVVIGYLLLTCGIAGGGVYVAYKTVSSNHRLRDRRRQQIQHQHYD